MKKIIYFFIFLIIIVVPINTYCNTEETVNEQKNTFGINSFLKKAKEFTGDEILSEDDINNIFELAVTGQVNNETLFNKFVGVLGKEFKNTLGCLTSILVIVIIHSILKSISEGLENDNISRIIYYVQYILIITIVMSNFSDIVSMIKKSTSDMVGFINILTPLLTSLMIFTGSITTSSMLEPTILLLVNLIGNLIQNILIPIVLVIASLSIISQISDKVKIDRLAKSIKSGIVWLLGIILTIFVGVISLEGTLSSSVDGITAKTTKAVVSSAIPIVGKILGDAVDTVLGCGIVLKNAVGIVGVIIVLSICVVPILKLVILTVSYKILARCM